MHSELEHAKICPGLIPRFVDLSLVRQGQVEEHDPVHRHQDLSTRKKETLMALRTRGYAVWSGADRLVLGKTKKTTEICFRFVS